MLCLIVAHRLSLTCMVEVLNKHTQVCTSCLGTLKSGTLKSGTLKSGALKSGTLKSGTAKQKHEEQLKKMSKLKNISYLPICKQVRYANICVYQGLRLTCISGVALNMYIRGCT